MVRRTPNVRPPGFARVEAIVLIVLVFLGLGLVPSCVQRRGGSSARTQCSNNLKQIGLGLHNFESTFKRMPPLFAGGTNSAGNAAETLSAKFPNFNGAPQVLLLPFIEQDNVWKLMLVSTVTPNAYVPSLNQANQKPIASYTCPADPGMRDGIQDGSSLGGTSYVANGQLFGSADPATGLPLDKGPWDSGLTIAGIKDGASNTLAFVHAYTRCGSVAGSPTTAASGAAWGYYNNGLAPSGNQGPPIFMHATINGKANVGPTIKVMFLNLPSPYNATFTGKIGCDPALPATPHSEAMVVLLADASMRTIVPSLAPMTWWLACSPDDGVPMPIDW